MRKYVKCFTQINNELSVSKHSSINLVHLQIAKSMYDRFKDDSKEFDRRESFAVKF